MLPFVLIVLGILMVIYTKKVHDFTGDVPFAEKFLGRGGTFLFLKLIGLALAVLSFMWMTGGLGLIVPDKARIFFGTPV